MFWKFLEVLQKQETVVRVGILQNEGGILHKEEDSWLQPGILRIVDDLPNC